MEADACRAVLSKKGIQVGFSGSSWLKAQVGFKSDSQVCGALRGHSGGLLEEAWMPTIRVGHLVGGPRRTGPCPVSPVPLTCITCTGPLHAYSRVTAVLALHRIIQVLHGSIPALHGSI